MDFHFRFTFEANYKFISSNFCRITKWGIEIKTGVSKDLKKLLIRGLVLGTREYKLSHTYNYCMFLFNFLQIVCMIKFYSSTKQNKSTLLQTKLHTVHIVYARYTSFTHGTRHLLTVHIIYARYTSSTHGTHHLHTVHIIYARYTSSTHGTHHLPTVHIIYARYTSSTHGTHHLRTVHIIYARYTSFTHGTHHLRTVHIIYARYTSFTHGTHHLRTVHIIYAR